VLVIVTYYCTTQQLQQNNYSVECGNIYCVLLLPSLFFLERFYHKSPLFSRNKDLHPSPSTSGFFSIKGNLLSQSGPDCSVGIRKRYAHTWSGCRGEDYSGCGATHNFHTRAPYRQLIKSLSAIFDTKDSGIFSGLARPSQNFSAI
jgi:hypothetical protein